MHIKPKFWLAGAGVIVLAAVAQEFMRMDRLRRKKWKSPQLASQFPWTTSAAGRSSTS